MIRAALRAIGLIALLVVLIPLGAIDKLIEQFEDEQ